MLTSFQPATIESPRTVITAGASGSFEVRRVTGNGAGTDTFTFVARRPGTQQVCTGRVRF